MMRHVSQTCFWYGNMHQTNTKNTYNAVHKLLSMLQSKSYKLVELILCHWFSRDGCLGHQLGRDRWCSPPLERPALADGMAALGDAAIQPMYFEIASWVMISFWMSNQEKIISQKASMIIPFSFCVEYGRGSPGFIGIRRWKMTSVMATICGWLEMWIVGGNRCPIVECKKISWVNSNQIF